MTEKGESFPQDARQQLQKSIDSVFGSWNNERAILYRKLNDIKGLLGTAVNVQVMVFGNMGETSGTGVCFSRDPSTGENVFYGEYLMNAQGEDVVAGIRTPKTLSSLEEANPEIYKELVTIKDNLEKHYKDMQDMEFTIERGRLYMLQTRRGQRSGRAAIKIACDMVDEGSISREEAVARIPPNDLDQLLHPMIDPAATLDLLTTGLPASPGAASGKIVFNAEDAVEQAARNEQVILVRIETSPEDIHGMHAAAGILTTRGGMTSHAAVVARGMGRPCVSGAGTVHIDYDAQIMSSGGETLKKGDVITVDGTTGQVLKGEVAMVQPELTGDFATLMGWADKLRRMGVRANADTPRDAAQAREFGAEGIGLCRTEHMFFDHERILAVREMILAESEEGRRAALDKILPMQRDDFAELFEIMGALPVTIRLLDPPLHEFLPQHEEEIAQVAQALGTSAKKDRKSTRLNSSHTDISRMPSSA